MIGAWLTLAAETAATAVATTAATAQSGLLSLPLASKGLLVTVFGLLGVFLVLLLFFFAIKLMQRFGEHKQAKE